MTNQFSNVLLKIFAATRPNKVKDTITAKDLLNVEPHKQECIDKLQNDLVSIRKRIFILITEIITLLIAEVIGLASASKPTHLVVRIVMVTVLLLMFVFLIFDVFAYKRLEKMIEYRQNDNKSNHEIHEEIEPLYYFSRWIDLLKYIVLGIIGIAVIVIVVSAYGLD